MTIIKFTKENWREIFRQKYGMKMKDMNLNEYMLLNSIGEDIEYIIQAVHDKTIQDVINFLYESIPKEKSYFFGTLHSNMFKDTLITIIKAIKDKFIDKIYDK